MVRVGGIKVVQALRTRVSKALKILKSGEEKNAMLTRQRTAIRQPIDSRSRNTQSKTFNAYHVSKWKAGTQTCTDISIPESANAAAGPVRHERRRAEAQPGAGATRTSEPWWGQEMSWT
jgi:hypothetical protein